MGEGLGVVVGVVGANVDVGVNVGLTVGVRVFEIVKIGVILASLSAEKTESDPPPRVNLSSSLLLAGWEPSLLDAYQNAPVKTIIPKTKSTYDVCFLSKKRMLSPGFLLTTHFKTLFELGCHSIPKGFSNLSK